MGQTSPQAVREAMSVMRDRLERVVKLVTTEPLSRTETRSRSPLRAIRLYCISCCNYQPREVRHCPSHTCPLWRFRFGVRPATAAKRGLPVDPSVASPIPIENDGRRQL